MPEEILDRIIRDVLPHVFRVDLVGDGEILLVPDELERILRAAKKHHILVNASTNGVLLDDSIAQMLVALELTDLNVSLDASTPDTFRAIRGTEMTPILQNIDRLNMVKRQRSSAFPRIHFSMVGMKRNIHELPGLVELASRHGAVSVMLQAMGEFETVTDESVFLRDKVLGRQWLETARETAARKKVELHLWPDDQFAEAGNEKNSVETVTSQEAARPRRAVRLKDCAFPWEIPYFAADGTVRPCCAMPPMGDLHTASFHDIWNGAPFRNLRNALNSPDPPKECMICPGRGWFTPHPCEDRLIPGRHDRQFGTGWFETECYKGEHYRWAREKSVFFIAGTGPAVLSVELHTVWDEGTTQTIDIQVDADPPVRTHFDYGERRRVYLPVCDPRSLHAVTLRGKVWRPVTTVPGERDPRGLSVMFYGAAMIPVNGPVLFEHGIHLTGWRIVKTGPVSVRVDLFWRLPTDLPDTRGLFIHGFQAPSNLKKTRLFGQELKRRFAKNTPFFQTDVDLTGIRREELALQSCSLTAPKGAPGKYLLYLGIRDRRNGRRVSIARSGKPEYRSAVELGCLEVEES